VPEALVHRVDRAATALTPGETFWSRVRPFRLLRAEDAAAPEQATSVRLAHDATGLFVRFDCEDRDIWATHVNRDAPLWEEEVVEVFIAPGEGEPHEYLEIEVNPLGTVFDARVANPDGRRDTMRVDASWNPPGLEVVVSRPTTAAWRAELVMPWSDLCVGAPPRVWRANFFRIERPRDAVPEFSCWSPTCVSPPDFHKPACFGRLVLDGAVT
jgi:hypothetical protein